MSIIEITDLKKEYRRGRRTVTALEGINLQVTESQFIVVKGPSGSGKTTLLLILAGMLKPTGGEVEITGKEIYSLSESARTRFRAEEIGYIFQMFHLIPYLNVFDNVLLGECNSTAPDRAKVVEVLKKIDLMDRISHKPAELSAGEQQRVALARALIKNPKIILADEPTGNLDSENAAKVMQYLKNFRDEGGTVVTVTHGTEADRFEDKVVLLNQ